ncbi:MAG: RNA polymerase sigma factor [Pseudolysinimonas sp.]|uniref:RNA polymerase sigma factor n=1 Tax=Pseudolysinimonas sp. TaxID=2680009 RepID=UPI0032661EB8
MTPRREGNEERIETALLPLMPRLHSYFNFRMRDPGDAADALAETLVVLWRRHRDIPDDPAKFDPWVFGIARRVLANARRGRRRHEALTAELRSWAPATSRQPTVDIDLRRALKELKEHDRELVLLVGRDGFTLVEAAQILKVKPEAARARYSRARRALREILAVD